MATRFYLPVSGSAIGLAPLPSLAPDSNWELRNGLIINPTSTAHSGSALQLYTWSWVSGTTQQWIWGQWQSERLQQPYYWSGTAVSMVVGRCAETTNSGDTHLAYSLRVVEGSTGTTVRGTLGLYHSTSTEFSLVASAQTRIHNRIAGGTPFSSQAGDRLIIELGLHGLTPALEAIQMRFGDPTGTADFALTAGLTTDLVPWVELDKDLAFGDVRINLDTANISTTGTPQIGISPLDLRTDGARSFDATGARIDFSNKFNTLGSPFTVSAWAKLSTDSLQNQTILFIEDDITTRSYGFDFGIVYTFVGTRPNQLHVGFNRATIDYDIFASGSLVKDRWYHLLATYDGSLSETGTYFYVDGLPWVADGNSSQGSGAETSHTGGYFVGARSTNKTFDFEGKIGEVALWNRVLTPTEITYLSNWGTLNSAGNIFSGLKFLFHPDEPKELLSNETGYVTGTASLVLGPNLTMGAWANLNTAKLVAQGQTGTISAPSSGVTINLSKATLTANGQILTVSAPSPGININLSTALLTANGRAITVQPGAVSKSLSVGQLTASGRSLTVQKGAVTINLSRAQLTATGRSLTVQPGAVSKSLNRAQLVATGRALTVQPGAISKSLSKASLSANGQQLTVQKGAVSKNLSVAQLTASGRQLTVQPGLKTTNLNVALLTAGGKQLTVSAPAPGAITINLSKASLTASGRTITPQPGAVTKQLDEAQLVSHGENLTVQKGAVTKNLNVALLTAGGKQLTVQAGAVTKNLGVAQLTASGRNVTVSASGSPVTINLSRAQLTANGRAITPQPGAVTKNLQRATITASGQQLVVQKGAVSIALDPALLTANGRTITPQPGTRTITFSRAQLTANGQHITITVPFPQTITLSRAQLTANGHHLTVNPVVPVVTVSTGGGGGFRRRNRIIVVVHDAEKKRKKVEEELLIMH